MRILVLGGTSFVGRAIVEDRQRGQPPLTGGFTLEQEQAVLAAHDREPSAESLPPPTMPGQDRRMQTKPYPSRDYFPRNA